MTAVPVLTSQVGFINIAVERLRKPYIIRRLRNPGVENGTD